MECSQDLGNPKVISRITALRRTAEGMRREKLEMKTTINNVEVKEVREWKDGG
jgi:hypothetical protein